jgi:polysaccharide chain length determinant protein (PEP-CTERM system associated)
MTNNATFFADLFGLLVKEGKRRLLSLTVLFSVVAVAALGVGVMLPKRWESTTVLVAETDNIIRPLMEGRAFATGIADQTAIVTQAVLSRRILREVLTFGGWVGRRSPQEEERLLNQLRSRIHIDSPREEMLRISYNDSDPKRTYQIANKLAEIYLRESTVSKERESREAFDFISKQVKEYGDKLADAHEKVLAYYRSQETGTVAPSPAPAAGEPEQTVKITPDELAALRAEEATLTTQLGRKRVAPGPHPESVEVEQQYRARVVQGQAELDRLLATYTEEHPDVKRARRSLTAATEDLHRVEQARVAREKAATITSQLDDDVAHAAQSRLEEVQRRIAAATNRRRPTMTTRVVVPDSKIDPELRGVGQDTMLSELLRRYEATRDVYQDLLKRRENARVSMELDAQHRGLTLRVQEAAEMPVTATSLRLIHISAIGLVLALAIPLAFLFVLVRFDPRVRSPWQIEHLVRVPLLATIPYAPSSADRSRGRNRWLLVVVMLAGVFAVYTAVFLIKLKTST